MWKKIFLIGGCVIGCMLIGGIVSFMYFMPTMAKGLFMMQAKEIFELGEAAQEADFKEPNEVALWAMTTYLKSLEKLPIERGIKKGEKEIYVWLSPVDTAIAHARLGNLYYRMGEKDKAQEHFKFATERAKGTCFESENTEEGWLKLVQRMDESALKRQEESK
jgi:hypothetical protein